MSTRIYLTAQLNQGCTAGCGAPIKAGMAITPGANGWEHASCHSPNQQRNYRPYTPPDTDHGGTRLSRALDDHRQELTQEEIDYVEDMIRRRGAA